MRSFLRGLGNAEWILLLWTLAAPPIVIVSLFLPWDKWFVSLLFPATIAAVAIPIGFVLFRIEFGKWR